MTTVEDKLTTVEDNIEKETAKNPKIWVHTSRATVIMQFNRGGAITLFES
jgi:hypothetical protein